MTAMSVVTLEAVVVEGVDVEGGVCSISIGSASWGVDSGGDCLRSAIALDFEETVQLRGSLMTNT